ncbi:MAG: hypothetical protein QXF52_00645 [Thermoproteota archaeon]
MTRRRVFQGIKKWFKSCKDARYGYFFIFQAFSKGPVHRFLSIPVYDLV